MKRFSQVFIVGFCLCAALPMGASVYGAKLIEVRPVDGTHLMVHWLDGEIAYKDDGEGSKALMGHESGGGDVVIRYEPALDTVKAQEVSSYRLRSQGDRDFARGVWPVDVFRKTKVNGTDKTWPEAKYTLEHTVYLKLATPLKQGQRYSLNIDPGTNSDTLSQAFSFDVFNHVSEAVHVNLIGYHPDHTAVKSADLYMWLGDGGARDYSDYVGRPVYLYNTTNGQKHPVGTVRFWKRSTKGFGQWNLTQSDVWACDFSGFQEEGSFRLVIEGVGSSPDFTLSRDIYYEPFKTSLVGFFYMRIGMGEDFYPPPRQPRFIPNEDPPGFKVYLTTFGPWHPDWKKIGGDVWDRKEEWAQYKEPGNPTNPNAWGGHSDALDWDRRSEHISISWDLLLPYFLSNGKLADDDLGIAESGNGIPDIIDEALYEIDYWLRVRDRKGGYSFGLNNPTKDHKTMYQAGARPFMAWASAASCAMVAECLRIAGRPDLMAKYRDAALEAWDVANGGDLDFSYNIGNGKVRGRDMKMMAAAYLYLVTGERKYEDAMAQESVVTGPNSVIDKRGTYSQLWGTAAYLMGAKRNPRDIHYGQLRQHMRAAMLNEAKRKHVTPSQQRPTRRSSDGDYSWFQGIQKVHALCIAHAASTDTTEQEMLLKAMLLEADYSLGRNPLNMVHMTGLGSRHVQDIYTSGRNDGVPGVHPGHTPYMGSEPWGKGYQADPKWYARKGYPAWENWPHAEALWRARYCYANNEFTPQQTMGGKTCLLGYLYSLGESHQ